MTKKIEGEESKAPETVVVDKAQLDSVLARLEKQDEEIKKLNFVADKSRLAHFEEKAGPKTLQPRYKISTLNGQVILAWRMIRDIVEKNVSTGNYYELQEYEYTLEDGTKGTVTGYNKFANIQYGNQIDVEEVSRNVSPEATMLKVRDLKTNKVYEIDRVFVN